MTKSGRRETGRRGDGARERWSKSFRLLSLFVPLSPRHLTLVSSCPMPRLIVRATPARGDSVVDLNRPRITIGRSARNDLCVEDPFASRLHAEVRKRGDVFWIADLGSANRTLVNTARLTAPVQLRDRDLIRIGETEIEYSERSDTAPARSRTSILFSDSSFAPLPEATIVADARNSAANLLSSLEVPYKTHIAPASDRRRLRRSRSQNVWRIIRQERCRNVLRITPGRHQPRQPDAAQAALAGRDFAPGP